MLIQRKSNKKRLFLFFGVLLAPWKMISIFLISKQGQRERKSKQKWAKRCASEIRTVLMKCIIKPGKNSCFFGWPCLPLHDDDNDDDKSNTTRNSVQTDLLNDTFYEHCPDFRSTSVWLLVCVCVSVSVQAQRERKSKQKWAKRCASETRTVLMKCTYQAHRYFLLFGWPALLAPWWWYCGIYI